MSIGIEYYGNGEVMGGGVACVLGVYGDVCKKGLNLKSAVTIARDNSIKHLKCVLPW